MMVEYRFRGQFISGRRIWEYGPLRIQLFPSDPRLRPMLLRSVICGGIWLVIHPLDVLVCWNCPQPLIQAGS